MFPLIRHYKCPSKDWCAIYLYLMFVNVCVFICSYVWWMVREENNAIIENNPFDKRTSLNCNPLSKIPCQSVMLLYC